MENQFDNLKSESEMDSLAQVQSGEFYLETGGNMEETEWAQGAKKQFDFYQKMI